MEARLSTRYGDAPPRTAGPPLDRSVGTLAVVDGPRRTVSAVGRRIGPFVLEGFVEGGPGRAVFRARRLGAGRHGPAAAVTILRDPSPEASLRQAFARERESLATLRHAAIPDLLGSGTTRDGWEWFATDLVVGRPLVQHATVDGLGLAERIRQMLEVCRAVDYAHRRGILHPDLRAERLVVTAWGETKVTGFGVPGTGIAANVQALGRILYELLSGARPYLTVLRGGGPPGPAWLPRMRPRPRADIDRVCLEALGLRGREGYPTAGALAGDLQRVLDRRPVSAGSGRGPAILRDLLRRLGLRGTAL